MQTLLQHLLVITLIGTSATIAVGQDSTQPNNVEPVLVQSQGLIFLVPQSRNKLMAYSTLTNSWSHTEIAIEESSIPLLKIQPTVGNTLAACQIGQELHAYSAKTGLWAKLKLPQDSKNNYSVGDNLITVYVKTEAGVQLYVFGEQAKGWSGVDLATGEQAPIGEAKQ